MSRASNEQPDRVPCRFPGRNAVGVRVYNAQSCAPAIVLTLIAETCPEPFIHNAEKAAYILMSPACGESSINHLATSRLPTCLVEPR